MGPGSLVPDVYIPARPAHSPPLQLGSANGIVPSAQLVCGQGCKSAWLSRKGWGILVWCQTLAWDLGLLAPPSPTSVLWPHFLLYLAYFSALLSSGQLLVSHSIPGTGLRMQPCQSELRFSAVDQGKELLRVVQGCWTPTPQVTVGSLAGVLLLGWDGTAA